MSRRVVVVLDKDSKASRLTYFRSEAERVARELDADGPYPLHTGRALVELADHFEDRSVEHLAICSHGGPDWLIHPKTGVTTVSPPRFPTLGQVDVAEVMWAWAPKLTLKCLLSLCACLCSRSPTWWLRRYLGRLASLWGSTWGARSYMPGGEASLSACCRDVLVSLGHEPDVRGHRSAGDAWGNPLSSKHVAPAGSPSVPLVAEALPNEPITIGLRRWWTRKPKKGEELACKVVRGRLAERWLLGDDSVPGEIAKLREAR